MFQACPHATSQIEGQVPVTTVAGIQPHCPVTRSGKATFNHARVVTRQENVHLKRRQQSAEADASQTSCRWTAFSGFIWECCGSSPTN